MDESQMREILILGGGIAGLTAALALKKRGFDAVVAEAAAEFRPVGAGITLAPNAMKGYRSLGLEEDVAAAGRPIETFQILDRRGRVISQTRTDLIGDGTPSVAIHRGDLHQVLLNHLDRSQILNGKKTREVEWFGDRYLVRFEDGSEITARHLIIAEGIHSVARAKLFPPAEIRYAGYTCWRGVTGPTDIQPTSATESWGSGRRFGLVPVGGGRLYWFAVVNSPADNRRYREFTRSEICELFADWHDPIPAVITMTSEEEIIWNDIIDLKPIRSYARGNAVLIGDAAHATTPNLGQGACQAIEDAVVLAECLARGREDIPGAFREFEAKRMKRTHHIVNRSRTMGKMAQMENRFMSALRDRLLRRAPESSMRKQLEEMFRFEVNEG